MAIIIIVIVVWVTMPQVITGIVGSVESAFNSLHITESNVTNVTQSFKSLLTQIYYNVSEGNWNASLGEVSKVQGFISQVSTSNLSTKLTQLAASLKQAILNKSQTEVDAILKQLNQSGIT